MWSFEVIVVLGEMHGGGSRTWQRSSGYLVGFGEGGEASLILAVFEGRMSWSRSSSSVER